MGHVTLHSSSGRASTVAARNALNVLIFFLLMSAGHVCAGQPDPLAKKVVAGKGCPDGADFQAEGYVVRKNGSRVDDPFDFLPWVRAREKRAANEIAALVDDKPFHYDAAVGQALEVIDRENFLPDASEARVRLRLEFVSVANCADHQLDLIYRVYSTQILPVLSGAPEARVAEQQSPQEAAGLAKVDVPTARPVRFIPTASYDSTNKLAGGGRLDITPKSFWKLPFSSFTVQGQGSAEMRTISAALAGGTDSVGWLAHSEWSLDYSNYSLPTGAGHLKGGHLSAQLAGTTKPLGGGNFIIRFGGLLEGGNRQSALRNVRLAPDTLPSDAFGALGLYAGLSSRFRHNVFSASYGLELGAVGPAARVDWRKHIGDFRHEFWYSLGDHRPLDVESRLTVGRLQVPGKIPLAVRFFGGNNEELFIPGDSWQIRANPVIRAIPGSRLYRTALGDGANSFVSYNLTAAYAVWRRPVVPQELAKDAEFNELLEGQLTSAESIEQLHYETKDPHYAAAVEQLKQGHVQAALAQLKAAVTAAQAAHPGQFPLEFKSCSGAINIANARANNAAQAKGAQQYGFVAALLSIDPDEDRLTRVKKACVEKLNGALNDPDIARAGDSLNNIHRAMETEFAQIDQSGAAAKAKADMLFTRRTLSTLFNDVNIYSISPVFVFDAARIGPARGDLGGVRYGPGGGLRLELASAVHFTAGYAWNIRQRPGEGRGTVFFAIGLRDLFRY